MNTNGGSLAVPDVLAALRDDNYRMGNCFVIPYTRTKPELFGNNFLYHLYSLCLRSRPSRPLGTLPETMCGMIDLSFDAIGSYLASKSVIIMAIDEPDASTGLSFTIAGFSFITTWQGTPPVFNGGPQPAGPRSAMAGYAFDRLYWGTPEIRVLAMLGLAYYFSEYRLCALHAQRYSDNAVSAKFLSQFGFTDQGVLPRFILQNSKSVKWEEMELVDCTLSTLLREDFVKYVIEQLLTLA
jgi:hypothetical protein